MKIRNGFVSNSSSSSFVVAVDGSTKTKIKIEIDVDLSKYGRIIKTKEELVSYFCGQYLCCDDNEEEILSDSWCVERYKKCLDAIERGKVVVSGFFSDECDPVEAMLCNNGLEGMVDESVEIIESEGGY